LIKLDIINEVVNKTGITKTKAEMAVETVFESMKKALEQGDRIELRGFGVFNVKPRKTGSDAIPEPAPRCRFLPVKPYDLSPAKSFRRCNRAVRKQTIVSPQDYSAVTDTACAANGNGLGVPRPRRFRERYWLHGLLFLLTLLSTTLVGAGLQNDFNHNLPFDVEHYLYAFVDVWSHPGNYLAGPAFSLTLLTILLAHECGHYLACLYYGVDASLPYFLPAPTLDGDVGRLHPHPLGDLFQARALRHRRRGAAGRLRIPAAGAGGGIAFSKVIPGIAHQRRYPVRNPGLLWILQKTIFPGVPPPISICIRWRARPGSASWPPR
jgi:DNA-binding protein HU-beta